MTKIDRAGEGFLRRERNTAGSSFARGAATLRSYQLPLNFRGRGTKGVVDDDAGAMAGKVDCAMKDRVGKDRRAVLLHSICSHLGPICYADIIDQTEVPNLRQTIDGRLLTK